MVGIAELSRACMEIPCRIGKQDDAPVFKRTALHFGSKTSHIHIPDLMPRALPFSISTQLMPTGLRNYKIRAAPLLRAASATACATASLTRGSNAAGRI